MAVLWAKTVSLTNSTFLIYLQVYWERSALTNYCLVLCWQYLLFSVHVHMRSHTDSHTHNSPALESSSVCLEETCWSPSSREPSQWFCNSQFSAALTNHLQRDCKCPFKMETCDIALSKTSNYRNNWSENWSSMRMNWLWQTWPFTQAYTCSARWYFWEKSTTTQKYLKENHTLFVKESKQREFGCWQINLYAFLLLGNKKVDMLTKYFFFVIEIKLKLN